MLNGAPGMRVDRLSRIALRVALPQVLSDQVQRVVVGSLDCFATESARIRRRHLTIVPFNMDLRNLMSALGRKRT